MHKLYAEGLMEQEAFTITGEEVTTKEQGDVYGSLGCGSAPFVMAGKDISYDANCWDCPVLPPMFIPSGKPVLQARFRTVLWLRSMPIPSIRKQWPVSWIISTLMRECSLQQRFRPERSTESGREKPRQRSTI